MDNKNMLLIDCCMGSGFDLELSESSSNGRLVKFRGKFQEAEAVNKNKRMYPFDVLQENIERLKETVRERRLVGELDHPCLTSSDFRVLTTNGWKEFIDIKVGDYVLSRVNGVAVTSRVNGVVNKPYKGEAYQVEGRNISCEFTPDHKFVIEDRNGEQLLVKIEDIYKDRTKYGHCTIPKTAKWNSDKKDTFAVEDLVFNTRSFMVLLGLYLSEGCLASKNGIMICQKTKYGRKLIREILPTLHKDLSWKENKNGFYVTDSRLRRYFESLGNCYDKHIPTKVKNLDSDNLEILLYWFAVGDGRIQKLDEFGSAKNHKENAECISRINMFSVSKKLIDDLHECLTKTGRCGSRTIVLPSKDYKFAGHEIKAESKCPLYQLHVCRSKSIHLDKRFLDIKKTEHEGRVYCLITEHKNFYMEHKGKSFWTGNCDSIIHFANASHIVTKLWWEGNIMMGEGEILNTPHGKVLKALIDDGVKIGISSRGVGNGKVNEDGILVIGESYKLITFDAVADPSTFAAFQEKVVSRDESFNWNKSPVRQERSSQQGNNRVKNEDSSIHKINKDLLVAYLGGFVNAYADKLKSRLG